MPLDLDSELLFVGDAGITEPGRPSRRKGIELTLAWFGRCHVATFELARTQARFTDADPTEGDRIPGLMPLVLGAGITGHYAHGWTATAGDGVEDVHFHAFAPRSVRLGLRIAF